MYASYKDYDKSYNNGIIPSESFNDYSVKASSRIDYYTSNRAKSVTDEDIVNQLISATCEIAELLYKQDQLKVSLNDNTSTKASETVGPHSISYVNKSSLQSQQILSNNELEHECYSIALRYLSTTGLMYRGR